MKTFTQFRDEIEGYKDVQKTAEAEEKIAVSDVHLFLKEAKNLKKYTKELERVLINFLYLSSFVPRFNEEKNKKKTLLILGGDKGFVGGLWHRLVSFSSAYFHEYQEIVVYGKYLETKIKEMVPGKFLNRFSFFPYFLQEKKEQNKESIFLLQKRLLELLEVDKRTKEKSRGRVDIIWPKLVTLSFFQPFKKTIFPFVLNLNDKGIKREQNDFFSLPIFEPNKKEVFKELMDIYLSSFLHQVIIETRLAESLTRAVAMEKAKREVSKIIKKTIYNFRSERRKILTKNQIEIFVAHKVSKS